MTRSKSAITRTTLLAGALLSTGLFTWQCTTAQLTGGGSDTEVSGRMLVASGNGAFGAIVALVDTGYDPAFGEPLPPERFDTTDAQGAYRFDSLAMGAYNIWAEDPGFGTLAFVSGISVSAGRATRVNDVTLNPAAVVRLLLPDTLAVRSGTVSIPGTVLAARTAGLSNVVEFPAVPQGVLPGIRFAETAASTPIVLFSGIHVLSADTLTLNPYNEVSGRIFESLQPAANASVTLIPADHIPAFGGTLPAKLTAVTAPDGTYHVYNVEQGAYSLYAEKGLKCYYPGITIDARKNIALGDVTIRETATLVVPIPDSLQSAAGVVYAPGTLYAARCETGATSVRFDSIAQGTYATIVYQRSTGDTPLVLFSDVEIDSAGTFVLDPFMNWQHEARVGFNTTAAGAIIDETVLQFPVLVRLTAADIEFSQAKPEGEDLRFARTDNSLLPSEIEYWDSATATAAVWVLVDTVRGNNATQSVRMLWGNEAAKKISQSARIFGTDQGFQGVWHLGESGPNAKIDATGNGFTGTPVEMDGSSDGMGVAGRAIDLDGSSQCVAVLNARNSRLDVQADSFYTVSVWVYSRNTQRDNRVIVSKGSAQYGIMVNDRNQWEFYGGLRGYGADTTTTSPATPEVWTLLTGVRKGMRQYLYVNGVLADSTVSAQGVNATISNNYYDLTFGRQSDDESQWFDGMIDELRVENIARPAAWIRLCHENQRTGQRFVQIQRLR